MDSFTKFTLGAAALMGGIGLIVFGCILYSLPVYLLIRGLTIDSCFSKVYLN